MADQASGSSRNGIPYGSFYYGIAPINDRDAVHHDGPRCTAFILDNAENMVRVHDRNARYQKALLKFWDIRRAEDEVANQGTSVNKKGGNSSSSGPQEENTTDSPKSVEEDESNRVAIKKGAENVRDGMQSSRKSAKEDGSQTS